MNKFLAFLLSCAAAAPLWADEVAVAVAANFAGPIEVIAQAFDRATGHHVRIALGASGQFYAQIRNGAPFQLFLSADQAKPAALEQQGLAVPGTRFTYAVGRLVLWSADPGMVDPNGQVLVAGAFHKLALANPKSAPYGEAAVETLSALGLETRLRPKLVFGDNVNQAYQFVASGNAEIGLVALSQVIRHDRPNAGSRWLVPQRLHHPIRQDAVLLKAGADSAAARQLLDFLKSETARRVIRAYGYDVD